jgi:triosephosphate isomerase
MTPLIAGNWKMNGLRASLAEVEKLAAGLAVGRAPLGTVAICPPATLLNAINRIAAPAGILLGGQDCAPEKAGAFTGDISAAMLADAGAQLVILGHSERRRLHGETDEQVRAKTVAAIAAGLTPIVCIGETEAERAAGQAEAVVTRQLQGSVPSASVVVAYEPVWAIGTGKTASAADIAAMHKLIRDQLVSRFGADAEGTRILYGGSMNPANAGEILRVAEVNGGLVGGASLRADDFLAIIRSL